MKNIVWVVYFRTLTCLFVKYSSIDQNKFFSLNRTIITDIYVDNSSYGTNSGVEETVDYLNMWRHIYASNKGKIQKRLYVSLYAYFLPYNNI
jgi:hypothetical protein